MTVVVPASRHHPARLVGVFFGGIAAFGLIAAAAYAVIYIVDNETSNTPPPVPAPAANLDLPAGMVVIRPTVVEEWRDVLGFDPVLPEVLPQDVINTPLYFLQPQDAEFGSAGHVRYAYADGTPAIALIEQLGGLKTDSPMKVLESGGTRVHIANMPCGDIVIQAQMFFAIDVTDPPAPADTTAAAEAFVTPLRDQCAAY
jgi:hypothetical protein